MELTPRLAAVARFIPPGLKVADIGTDHAMLPVKLVESGRTPYVIATDINEKPYLAACRQVQASGAGSRVDVRKGNGLEVIRPGEIDVVVAAGMGGNTIIGILEQSRDILNGITRLVFQPMADAGSLRLWLARSGWRLVEEELVREGDKFYVIMAAEPGVDTMEDQDHFLLEIGPLLAGKYSQDLLDYLEKIKMDLQRVLSGLTRSRSRESMNKAVEITNRLTRLKELIDRCRRDVMKSSG